jgi:transcription elongation GreA/GreB family factor
MNLFVTRRTVAYNHEHLQSLLNQQEQLQLAVNSAIAYGDLKENGEFQAATASLQIVKHEINNLLKKMAEQIPCDLPISLSNVISFGNWVILEIGGEKRKFILGDASEWQTYQGKDYNLLSITSPVGQLLLGAPINIESIIYNNNLIKILKISADEPSL